MRPEISKWLGRTIREAINRPIRSGVNGEPQAKVKGRWRTNGSRPTLLKRKLKSFELIIKLIRDNEKTAIIEAKALREKARAEQDK